MRKKEKSSVRREKEERVNFFAPCFHSLAVAPLRSAALSLSPSTPLSLSLSLSHLLLAVPRSRDVSGQGEVGQRVEPGGRARLDRGADDRDLLDEPTDRSRLGGGQGCCCCCGDQGREGEGGEGAAGVFFCWKKRLSFLFFSLGERERRRRICFFFKPCLSSSSLGEGRVLLQLLSSQSREHNMFLRSMCLELNLK